MPKNMRKEIIGIVVFFLVIFCLISLLSYSPDDPSFLYAGAGEKTHNLFGVVGAHLSGLLIGLFGLGAFWIPVLLLLICLHIFGDHPGHAIWLTAGGGLLLIISTGSLLAFQQDHYVIFGIRFTSGGLVGLPLKSLLAKYTNVAGGTMTMIVVWIIGLILATGFSMMQFIRYTSSSAVRVPGKFKNFSLMWKERRRKTQKRSEEKKQKTAADAKEPRIAIRAPAPKPIKDVPVPRQEVFPFMKETDKDGFQLPSVAFLEVSEPVQTTANDENLRMQSRLLEKKLEDFGVQGKVSAVIPGPVVTTFEYEPASGVKINKVANLSDDLALTLRAISIRIVAPIPGKAAIGIEIPNAVRDIVRFRDIIVSESFQKSKSRLTMCLGKDIEGRPVTAELERMPHLLIAGATGTGKSVALNTMICSLLYKSTPTDVKFIMVDPKRIELSMYNGIPHLITPVVTDVKKATHALYWAVKEMERRYELLSEKRAKNIAQYNQKIEKETPGSEEPPLAKLPFIVIIIDELADLMMVASRDVEVALTRLAQMARAAGIHLILATQRPSVDVLTGIIKANFPTRLTFQVSSKTDSRTIIDANGAENLLGNGDMLFLPPGTGRLQRIHGAYISEPEITQITEFLKKQAPPDYDASVITAQETDQEDPSDPEAHDERYDDAVALVTRTRQASISMVQRHLRIGYNRAARIIEMMEKEGIVGPSDGAKTREVLVQGYDDMD
ncbi:MAG: DNA translocase FtsK [Desulfobacterales bacterium]|jgi:S-DNA-T family DNA segregation ATPase FtsK/SpoIIIE|nr:DNA translocase FtsK [Desulfobacterales bacterium]MDY0378079.1 DNA translocase FtsK [Desulfobacterales bacterium]